jgi:DNA-binding NarL/FixJ family response regulator
MYFSFDASTSLAGLSPVPLPVSSIVISAVAGAEVAQKSRLIDNSEYIKEAIALIAAPGCAFVLTYIIFHMTEGNPTGHTMDFVVIGVAVIVLITLAFVGYARRQSIQKEATERLVYAQQQQIYENSRALNDMELKVVLSENQALHNAVEMKRQEVMNVALSIVEQREYLESLNSLVKQLSMTSDGREKDRLISELGASLRQRLSYDRDIDSQYFYAQAESLHEDFNAKLSENFPDLTQQEKRLATLLRLGFSSKYIATLMNITPKSVEISRYRLRQKLGLSKGENLVNYIKSI